jgi:uncharacterized protein (DUF433 family)
MVKITIMNLKTLTLTTETIPLNQDEFGAIRVGKSRVLLELVIRAFLDGVSPESIIQGYETLSLSDVYLTIGYYLNHKSEIDNYLQQREQLAETVSQRLADIQPDLSLIRSRLLSQKLSNSI